jgi:diguanylate cyclase (GGDEF)-like protein
MLAYVTAVVAADLAAIAAAGAGTRIGGQAAWLFGVLLVCNGATVELTRRGGEPAGLVKDVHAVWELPLALLLPPIYALIAPIPRMALVQWRVRPTLIHRRVFTAAAVGLSYGAASMAFHMAVPEATGWAHGAKSRLMVWVAAAILAGVLKSAVNKVLVWTAIRGADPSARARDQLFSREPLFNDLAELSVAVTITSTVVESPFMALVALPLVALLHRSARHAQLVDAGRIDAKTGLLNAAAWQREAGLETARASRTRAPLSLAIIDIDHFKRVNDTFGHLAGDTVLAAIASAISALLRDGDIIGRFGGEEFVAVLPGTCAGEALQIADRLREKIARIATPIAPASDGTGKASPLQVTVSIGLAALSPAIRDLTDLLAAADSALYTAKGSGRNQVRISPSAPARQVAEP